MKNTVYVVTVNDEIDESYTTIDRAFFTKEDAIKYVYKKMLRDEKLHYWYEENFDSDEKTYKSYEQWIKTELERYGYIEAIIGIEEVEIS